MESTSLILGLGRVRSCYIHLNTVNEFICSNSDKDIRRSRNSDHNGPDNVNSAVSRLAAAIFGTVARATKRRWSGWGTGWRSADGVNRGCNLCRTALVDVLCVVHCKQHTVCVRDGLLGTSVRRLLSVHISTSASIAPSLPLPQAQPYLFPENKH